MSPRVDSEFWRHHAQLRTATYRLTGNWMAIQFAMGRAQDRFAGLDEVSRNRLDSVGGWLAAAMCRAYLESVTERGQRNPGARPKPAPWFPEPIVMSLRPPRTRTQPVVSWIPDDLVPTLDALDGQNRISPSMAPDDGVRMAAMLAQHALSVEQRIAFVLFDVFGLPFTGIADVLECTPVTARQLAADADRLVAEADPPPRVKLSEQHRILKSLMSIARTGDVNAIATALHPDVTVVTDTSAAVSGVEATARFCVDLAIAYDMETLAAAGPVLTYEDDRYVATGLSIVNGDLGLVAPGDACSDGHARRVGRVTTFAYRDARIIGIYDIVGRLDGIGYH